MIAIIDYDAGNLTSVARAMGYLGQACEVTRDPETIKRADRIIFPGVGAAGSAMESLTTYHLDESIRYAFEKKVPILGICLGTQVILGRSEEGDTPCIGLVPGDVLRFDTKMRDVDNHSLKIPHMGWNRVTVIADHPVLKDVQASDEFYFVHSYYPAPLKQEHVLAETEYGMRFASALGFNNLVATQFHPEKSGRPGLKLLSNFCHWKPSC